jgi:hypothetical protein
MTCGLTPELPGHLGETIFGSTFIGVPEHYPFRGVA